MQIAEAKKELRLRMQELRRSLPSRQKQQLDQGITATLLATPEYRNSRRIFLYYSMPEEVDTRAILRHALAQGKTVCIPKCLPNRQMEARQIRSEADLTEETYGIPEPGAHCPVIVPEDIDLIVVPALCCDRRMNRLGYGGGYYDRYLRRTAGMKAILCPRQRVVDAVPADGLDTACDWIVTENEVISPSGHEN